MKNRRTWVKKKICGLTFTAMLFALSVPVAAQQALVATATFI